MWLSFADWLTDWLGWLTDYLRWRLTDYADWLIDCSIKAWCHRMLCTCTVRQSPGIILSDCGCGCTPFFNQHSFVFLLPVLPACDEVSDVPQNTKWDAVAKQNQPNHHIGSAFTENGIFVSLSNRRRAFANRIVRISFTDLIDLNESYSIVDV